MLKGASHATSILMYIIIANFEVHEKIRGETAILKLQSVKS